MKIKNNDNNFLKKYLVILLKEQQKIKLKTNMKNLLYKTPTSHLIKKNRKNIARIKTLLNIKNFNK